jgi:hypothetical protein
MKFCIFFALAVLLGHQFAKAQHFTNLLHERSFDHWMTPDGSAVESGWTYLSDGTLHLAGRGGNIVTRDEYGDFELWFDYRIAPRGNNGIKYRVRQYGNAWLGLEYQIQDDGAFPNMAGKHRTASLYDIVDRSTQLERLYQPIDEFNSGRVVVQNHRLRHWLNGRLMIDECDCSARFGAAITDSKFRDRDGFGRNHCGRLMLTDHGTEVWYRNLFVRRLDGAAVVR